MLENRDILNNFIEACFVKRNTDNISSLFDSSIIITDSSYGRRITGKYEAEVFIASCIADIAVFRLGDICGNDRSTLSCYAFTLHVVPKERREYDLAVSTVISGNIKLLHFSRMAASGEAEYLSLMSHEMRTPMNSIIGLSTIAAQESYDQLAVVDSLSKIKGSAGCLLNLINDTLDKMREENGLEPEAACTALPENITADYNYDFTGRRVLLVEDHPLNIQVAKKLLEMRGTAVEVARNGREAVDIFSAAAPGHYDAVLMDVRMPVMDGLCAADLIRSGSYEGSRIPIIAMTANAFRQDEQNSLNHGMNAHLAKPIDPSALYATLQKFFEMYDKQRGL